MLQQQHMQDQAAQDEISQIRQQLGGLREEFHEFVYRVSHDVNAPMRSVVNFCELFARKFGDTLLDNQAQDYLSYITKGVTQAQDMLAGLLEYSRINTMSNPPAEVDCNLLLERCQRALHAMIERNGAIIKAENLPTVIGEGKQLEKLFCVLIENAIHYRSEQPPEITVKATHTEDGWRFDFSDNGVGIPAKYHDEIFQVFRCVHQGDGHPGLGMGLALAKKIVRHHRGTIWLTSEAGKGTTFSFTLPASDLLTVEGLL